MKVQFVHRSRAAAIAGDFGERTDSNFNSRHGLEPSRQPSFCQQTEQFNPSSVRFFRLMRRPDGLVLRSGQFACPVTLRTGLRHQGIWELGRFWAIGESPRPDWRVRVAKMGLGLSKTATDGRYRNSGSRTSWSSRGSARSRSESSDAGGDLAVANVRSGPSHKPPTIAALWCLRRIFSTTSR